MEVLVLNKFILFFMISVLSFTFSGERADAQNVTNPNLKFQEQNTMSVLWFQKAGETNALYYQGYNVGKMRLDEILRKKPKKPAIVLDIDETIVDNSPLFAANLYKGKKYTWEEWINQAKAKALPGAVDFLKYADRKGVDLFYISNRKAAQKEATIKNLKQIGAPHADKEHVLLLEPGERVKESRRQHVAITHNIILLFGDNLGDFNGFDELSASGRMQSVDRRKDEFGKKLIVFPNPMYGDWEDAIYLYDPNKSLADKAKLRKESLEIFQP
jgi:5'-nucleotidase (lipoprotein e(P4) family)